MPSLSRNEKVTGDNCGFPTTKLSVARHKKSCSAGTFYCNHCHIFSTKSRNDLNYHIAISTGTDVTFNCKLCYQEFPGFYALRQHENIQHGFQIKTKQMLFLTILSTKLRMQVLKRSCVLVNLSWSILNLKKRDTNYSIMQ